MPKKLPPTHECPFCKERFRSEKQADYDWVQYDHGWASKVHFVLCPTCYSRGPERKSRKLAIAAYEPARIK